MSKSSSGLFFWATMHVRYVLGHPVQ